MDSDDPTELCAICGEKLETTEERLSFTEKEDIILIRCQTCKTIIYVRRGERVWEAIPGRSMMW